MSEATLLPFDFPAVQRKKVIAAFDGGRLTSDGGVMLLAAAERRLGIVNKLAALMVTSDLGPASIVGLPLDCKPGQAASKIASTVAVRQRRRILR